jgi:6-phosphogluconolactonase
MNSDQIRHLAMRDAFAIVTLAVLLSIGARSSLAYGDSGAVYTMTNQSTGNSVLVFDRAADGTLTFAGSFATGGNGMGTGADPLGSQGAVVLDQSDQLLFAVNAGSNEVSVLAVEGDRLRLLNKVNSGGQMPVSVTVHGRLVYVLNAGGTPNVTGFIVDPLTDKLINLQDSTRDLAGGSAADPAEVSFSLDGAVLAVTEKATQTIDTYTVNRDGFAGEPIANHSSGSTPFGFEFTYHDLAIVSESGATSNALSSYKTEEEGALDLVTGSLMNGQQADCWAIVTKDGRYAYTVNAGSGTLSSYAVSPQGVLTLLNPIAATFGTGPGSAPTDPALSADGALLYVRVGGLNQIYGLHVEADGSLTPIGTVGGIPTGGQGLAAY